MMTAAVEEPIDCSAQEALTAAAQVLGAWEARLRDALEMQVLANTKV